MTIAVPQSRLLACLLGVAILGPIGCATQQATSFQNDPAMNAALPPLDVYPGLDQSAPMGNAQNQALPPAQSNGPESPAPTQPIRDPWPRQVAMTKGTALVYLPQVESWQGNTLDFRAAVSVRNTASSEETFGVARRVPASIA